MKIKDTSSVTKTTCPVTIRVGEFVRRQTKESRFSYYEDSWLDLIHLVERNYANAKPGYRDGVKLVQVPPDGFYSAIVPIREAAVYNTKAEKRREGEDVSLVTTMVNGRKTPAKSAVIVLYREDVLAEDPLNGIDPATARKDVWEIISINASPLSADMDVPMRPYAMVRNELELPGGTKASYSKEQYIDAIKFWATHTMVEE